MKNAIGIGITTHNRNEQLLDTYKRIKCYSPEAKVVIVDDASTTPIEPIDGVEIYRFERNVGIAMAKNKCLELLKDSQHIFLFDDDTYPQRNGWELPYIFSKEPHLMYQFPSAPSHWKTEVNYSDDVHLGYDYPRGCMMYIENRVLDVVGGLHTAFGKHGFEHEDWSRRIHEAGLTTQPFMDVKESDQMLYCQDQDHKGISTVNWNEHNAWRDVDRKRLTSYAEFRQTDVPVLVARRGDNGHRDSLWAFAQQEWHAKGMRTVEGQHNIGPFNRSAAINLAARVAGNWDVAIIADSDAYIDFEQVYKAVYLAQQTGKLVSAFDKVIEINKETTLEIIDAEIPVFDFEDSNIDRVRTEPLTTQSLVLAVPRSLFERVEGFDEKFVGWGGEDNAFWKACEVVGGEVLRIPGNVYHLWHEIADKSNQPSNNSRWYAYTRIRNLQDLKAIRKLN